MVHLLHEPSHFRDVVIIQMEEARNEMATSLMYFVLLDETVRRE
jgi:hypothetical protein